MTPLSILIMSFSMSADAFAVSISKGVSMKHPSIKEALKVGLLFGAVEAITPLLGWLAGSTASSFIESIDHWVCFVILAIVGGKMIYESLQQDDEEESDESEIKSSSKLGRIGILILTAVGTSIDAAAVGVSMAFMNVNIWTAALSIGAATTMMVTIGMMAGHYLGVKVGKYAEAGGGVALIAIGTHMLLVHLGYL
ncbi:manganese efflux pump MntP family protein [Bdellovibrio sp. SKB1291214]|uniref:manganese efflux pump MntP n=1 Tax=Bdellovibrio sp. SKB1291214 TaxID=1732569 RepID=UPI000B5171AD|nr:manganese efflux pump MntP family protein [Bdellovibrio sp. SKB1291214]UYL07229.1 manganese efflux pump MntP family protein [Bdellovibrio sp. SKB1291214]